MNTDIFISGAGPTGLTLALQLAKLGIDFIIIDKKSAITELSKALGIQCRTLELFDDMNIIEPFLEQGNTADKGNIIVRGELKTSFNMKNIGEGLSPYPYMLTLPQDKTEAILYGEMKKLGKDVLWNTELTAFSEDKEGVKIQVVDKKGEIKHITAKYLVGCDGASSFVRNQLKFNFEGDTQGKYFYVVDAKIDWDLGNDDDFYNCFCEETFVAFMPVPGEKRFRIIGVLPKKFDNPDSVTLDQIVDRIKSDSEIPMEITQINWHSVYKVHTRKADSFRKGNCFIAGDAGHVHTPAGGQGMNTGIQDSYNLAWKFMMVINGTATDKILNTYDFERERNARNLLEGTDKAFELQSGDAPIYVFLRMQVIPRIANWLLSFNALKQRLFLLFSQINIKYPESPLSIESKVKKIEAGDRFPYFRLANGKSIYDYLKGPHYILISKNETSNIDIPHFVIQRQIEDLPTDIFGESENLMILVRPDNHISYIGSKADEVENFFKNDLFC